MRASFDDIVASPPVDSLAYQARELQDALHPFLKNSEPPEAQQLARLLYSITSWVVEELTTLSSPASRRGSDVSRALALAALVHTVYNHLRYLKSSDPSASPPAIQSLVRVLADTYHPRDTLAPFLCLVRPQSRYNYTSYAASVSLELNAEPLTLDPNNRLGASTSAELLQALWERASNQANDPDWPAKMPGFMGILGFAGLDTEDVLMVPLLAHELGHAFDFAASGTRPSTAIARKVAISIHEIKDALPDGTDFQGVIDYTKRVQALLESSIREALADLLAAKMLGLSFFVALAEFLKTGSADWPQRDVLLNGYPGIASRLRAVYAELTTPRDRWDIREFLDNHSDREEAQWLSKYLDAWKDRLAIPSPPADGIFGAILSKAFAKAQPEVEAAAAQLIPDDKCARLGDHFFPAIDYLRAEVPPGVHEQADDIVSMFSAGWTYQLVHGEEEEVASTLGSDKSRDCYRKTCRLIHKALELAPVPRDLITDHVGPDPDFPAGILTHDDIQSRIALSPHHPHSLAVVPFARPAVQAASIDVRLGSWFSVARRPRLSKIDLSDKNALEVLRDAAREQHYVPFDHEFVIHPGDFVLGVTLEFFGLPNDITCTVEGRSSIGRTGLIVATATPVAPGFRGVFVLELANAGTVPLAMKPGMGIGQVVLNAVATPVTKPYRGRYHCQMRP